MKNEILEIARKAGNEILGFYGSKQLEVNAKQDASPVTSADYASNEILLEGLSRISKYPIVSEEQNVPYEKRKDYERYWLIDPLDGTKDFLQKNDEFCINIALIQNREPIFGLIYVPVSSVAYAAAKGEGAFRIESDGGEFPIKNTRSDEDEKVCASSRQHTTKEVEDFCRRNSFREVFPCGSAIKFCRLAEGLVDAYPRFAPCSDDEWEIRN